MSGTGCGARRKYSIVVIAALAALAVFAPAARAVTFAPRADYSLPDPTSPFNAPSYAGVAIGDLNGDGRPEIMVPRENAQKLWVFPNQGDGTFGTPAADTDACPNKSPYPSFGRQGAGGNPFLILLCTGDQFQMLPADGHGGFASPTSSGSVTNPRGGMAVGAVDGQQDLVFDVGTSTSQDICLLDIADFKGTPNCDSTGEFKERTNQFALASIFPPSANQTPRVVDLADANDFGFAGYGQSGSVIIDPSGDTFQGMGSSWADGQRYASADNGQLVAAGDLNGDGVDDVVVANSTDTTASGSLYTLLARPGTGGFALNDKAFSAGTAIPDPSFFELADFNGDGKLDAIVAGTDNGSSGPGVTRNPEFALMLGHGDGTFDPPQLFSTGFSADSTAWWLGVGDLNADGKTDVVIANGDEQTVRVFLNTTPLPSGGGGGVGGTGGGGAGGGGGPGGGVNPVSVTLAALHATAYKFHIGKLLAHFTRNVPVGTTISFSVSGAAHMTFAFLRLAPGKNSGRRCVAAKPNLRHARSCTQRLRAGGLSFNATAGPHKLFFDGRLSRRKTLRPGRYELDVTATANGRTSKTQKLLLTLLPPVRH